MKKKVVCMAGAVLVAGMAAADTVAWWRFDDDDPGTTANSGVVTESIGGSTATSYYLWSNKVEQVNNEYRPAFWRAFPGLAVYDPVAGTTNANHAAMKFVTARGGATPNTNAGRAYYGGALKIDGGRSLYSSCTSAFTVEAFVCTTGGVCNTFAPIIGCMDDSNWTGEKWAIYMEVDSYSSGGIAVRLNTSAGSTIRYQSNATRSISDGYWHHIAYTYDGTAAKIYIDYNEERSFTGGNVSGTISYGSNNATWIGGYGTYDNSHGGRKFPGLIDEVRVSNVALTSDKFLRLVPADANEAETDPDVALRLRFDASGSQILTDTEVIGGTFDLQVGYHAVPGSAPAEIDIAAKAGDVVADTFYSDGDADASSYFQVTNAAGKANFIKVPNLTNRLFPDGASSPGHLDYTIETFFKFRGSSPNRHSIFKIGSGNNYLVAQVITGDASFPHQLQFAYRTNTVWQGITSSSGKPIDDGKWHHIAFVSDTARNRVLAYLDYTLVESRTGSTPEVPTGYSLFLGANDNNGQFFDGWIDDVRVTKRTLRPDEFLTTHPVGGGAGPTPLFFADFENNYAFTCASNGYWSVAGSGLAHSNGNAPTFEKVSPGALLLDGTNGSDRVANDYSVRLNKSHVDFPVSPLYEQRTFTVEFWANFTGIASADGVYAANATLPYHAGILRFNRDSGTEWDWFFYRLSGNSRGTQVAVRNAAGEAKYLGFTFNRVIADGKWHHYAITFETNEANTETTVSVYDDYKLVGDPQTCAGIYPYSGGHKLQFGMGSSNPPFMLGYINSVRLSRGVLSPDRFLGRVRPGMVVVFR